MPPPTGRHGGQRCRQGRFLVVDEHLVYVEPLLHVVVGRGRKSRRDPRWKKRPWAARTHPCAAGRNDTEARQDRGSRSGLSLSAHAEASEADAVENGMWGRFAMRAFSGSRVCSDFRRSGVCRATHIVHMCYAHFQVRRAAFPGRPGGLPHLPTPDGRRNWPVFLESPRGVSALLQQPIDTPGEIFIILTSRV